MFVFLSNHGGQCPGVGRVSRGKRIAVGTKSSPAIIKIRTGTLRSQLQRRGHDVGVNQRLSSEQPSLARALIIFRAADQIKPGGCANHTVKRARPSNVMTYVEPRLMAPAFDQFSRCVSIGPEENSGGNAKRKQPFNITASRAEWRGPDRPLIPKNVADKLLFQGRRRRWARGRF